MKHVVIVADKYDPGTWSHADVDDVCAYIKSEFVFWPDHVVIYHNQMVASCNVTPDDELKIQALQKLEGTFYVVIEPKDIISAVNWAIGELFSLAVSALIPKPNIPVRKNQFATSPNNDLSNRQNTARINGRVPYIVGKVRSTPDLIAVPYSVYENNTEVEHCIMCIGEGEYEVTDAYDDTTSLIDIAGASAQLYDKNEDIVTGTPFKVFGTQILDTPWQVQKSTAVNGQVLRPSNSASVGGSSDIAFHYPNEIVVSAGSSRDLTKTFGNGDTLTIQNASFTWLADDDSNPATPDVEHTGNLNGTYTILGVTSKLITLSNPAAVNPYWDDLDLLEDEITPYGSPILIQESEKWIGTFVLSSPTRTHVLCNFVALNGLYKDSGQAQYSFSADIEIEVTPIDLNDSPIGSPELFTITLTGSDTVRETVGMTLYAETSFTGRCKVRARRSSLTDYGFQGQVVDEVKWKDLYGARELERTQFGDFTLVRSRNYATAGALSVKDRKLNFLVQRKLPTYDAVNNVMTTELSPTNHAGDIIVAMSLDPKIGRRSINEVDIASIYQKFDQLESYFGTSKAIEFCYTFDNENLSFEESINMITDAVFCEPYRQGNVIRINPEMATNDSVLLFNHRNKVPKTEKRTDTFGIQNSYDGVELEYTSDIDDARIKYYIPNDKSAKNPQKISMVGVRNETQAYFLAWRAWNKLRYQRQTVELSTLRESELLVRSDRVLIADNTRFGTQAGQITSHEGMVVTTDQPCVFEAGKTYVMHLQLYDGSVDAIDVTAGVDRNHVVLARAPLLELVTANSYYIKTHYILVSNDFDGITAFMVMEKSPVGKGQTSLKCINYDERYYQNDQDRHGYGFNYGMSWGM